MSPNVCNPSKFTPHPPSQAVIVQALGVRGRVIDALPTAQQPRRGQTTAQRKVYMVEIIDTGGTSGEKVKVTNHYSRSQLAHPPITVRNVPSRMVPFSKRDVSRKISMRLPNTSGNCSL